MVELANTDTAGAVNQRLLLQSSGDDASSVSQEPEFITAASVAAAPCNSGDNCAEVFLVIFCLQQVSKHICSQCTLNAD